MGLPTEDRDEHGQVRQVGGGGGERVVGEDREVGAVRGPAEIATAFGSFLPRVIVCSLGAFAATAVDMTDPRTALEGILPGWFTPVFMLALVLGTISINALTAYSAGLALQAVGIRIRRSRSVIVDGVVAVALTLYALLVSNSSTPSAMSSS